ncbi:MAG: glycine--tRNA ligase subunit beta, partial [Chroococcales cyanobacterium]
GSFDKSFLDVPPECLTSSMKQHQKYIPLYDQNGKLAPHFLLVSNMVADDAGDTIIKGNEKVLAARLSDAKFFWEQDLKLTLESRLPKLKDIKFHDRLGSVYQRVERLQTLSQALAPSIGGDSQLASSAAKLCKADLVSQMVYEFPELQGVMGEKYAIASGESEIVAKGIFEHYLPRGADDILPETLTGQVVGLSDRLDTLVSIFGLGMIPTGSSDPFALRRASNAIISIIWNAELGIDLYQLIQQLSSDFVKGHPDKESPESNLKDFFLQRIQTLLQDEENIDYDLVNAVLGENDPEYIQRALKDLLDVRDRARFLQQIRNNGKLDEIYETVNRSTRLAAKGDLNTQQLKPQIVVQPEFFEQSSEQALYDALVDLVPKTEAAQKERNYQSLVDALANIAPTVSNFFDGPDSVLVMAEDPAIRGNRLNLLGLLRNHARVLADFGPIVKSA